jgi:hypothetical protein
VKSPEEALSAARQRARATGPASDSTGPPVPETPHESLRRLAAWAIIEPDETEVYSTRRLGAPVTLLKRLLVRLLRQYLDQVTAQQSRFNAHLLAHLIALEERVARLESDGAGAASASPPAPGTTEASGP